MAFYIFRIFGIYNHNIIITLKVKLTSNWIVKRRSGRVNTLRLVEQNVYNLGNVSIFNPEKKLCICSFHDL